MPDWFLTRRDFLKSSGLLILLPYTRRRRPPKLRGTPIGLTLVFTRT